MAGSCSSTARPEELGKKREQHAHTPLQANRRASQHTKPKRRAILCNTSIFQGLRDCDRSQALEKKKPLSPALAARPSEPTNPICSFLFYPNFQYCVRCNAGLRKRLGPKNKGLPNNSLLLQALLQELEDALCAAGNWKRQELISIAANISQLNTDPKREGRRDEG